MSSKIKSGCNESASSKARAPSRTARLANPARAQARRNAFWTMCSVSTIRIRGRSLIDPTHLGGKPM